MSDTCTIERKFILRVDIVTEVFNDIDGSLHVSAVVQEVCLISQIIIVYFLNYISTLHELVICEFY